MVGPLEGGGGGRAAGPVRSLCSQTPPLPSPARPSGAARSRRSPADCAAHAPPGAAGPALTGLRSVPQQPLTRSLASVPHPQLPFQPSLILSACHSQSPIIGFPILNSPLSSAPHILGPFLIPHRLLPSPSAPHLISSVLNRPSFSARLLSPPDVQPLQSSASRLSSATISVPPSSSPPSHPKPSQFSVLPFSASHLSLPFIYSPPHSQYLPHPTSAFSHP